MPHDFKKFPELTNSQMDFYYLESPHKQITEDIRVKVVKVHDGDTITVQWNERNFNFPVRLLDIDAPELSAAGGDEARRWLDSQILNENVDLLINTKNRVEKWGRLLAKVMFNGIEMGEAEISAGLATTFAERRPGQIPNIEKILSMGDIKTI